MTRFLQRLGARAVDGLARVEPRLASRFEPAQPGPGTSAPLVAEDSDAGSEPPAPRPSQPPPEAGSRRSPSPIGSRTGSSLEREPTPSPPPARDSEESTRQAHPDSASDPGDAPAPRTRARVLAADPDAFDSASPDRHPAPAPASPESAEADERSTNPADTPAPDALAGLAVFPESRLRRLESALAALESEVSNLSGDAASEGSSPAVGGSGRDHPAGPRSDGRVPAEKARSSEAPPPAVHLHIGRIIVRAQQPGPAAAAARGRPVTDGIGGTLEQYLARRSRGTL